jgi:oxygen-independent coproporphyrinogen III oxidase
VTGWPAVSGAGKKGQRIMNKPRKDPGGHKRLEQQPVQPACRPGNDLTGPVPMPELLSLYVHVPFCIRKCPYCDFFSVMDLSLVPAYVAAVCREIRLRAHRAGPWARVPAHTVYFGGGTPSLLSLDQVGQILDTLQRCFCLTAVPEVTFEVNPGTVDLKYLAGLRILGINRLSIGAQSFDPAKLRFLSRIHTRNQVKDTLAFAARAGFTNLGVDLMYALPGETSAVWHKDLETVLEFRPAHLSCYMLTLEPGTPFFASYKNGALNPCDADRRTAFFVHTAQVLESAGFIHYEVSNFAADDTVQSSHNTHYWDRGAYLGMGPSAHSFLPEMPAGLPGPGVMSKSDSGTAPKSRSGSEAEGKAHPGSLPSICRDSGPVRSWNISDLHIWLDHLGAGRLPCSGHEILTPAQEQMEQVMLGLRQRKGIAVKNPKKEIQSLMDRLSDQGLGIFFHQGDKGTGARRFRLTRSGLTCLDSIVDAFAGQIL